MKKLICFFLTFIFASGMLNADDANVARLDFNADGMIDVLDLTFVAARFGETPAADETPTPDLNSDSTVNILDLVLVASHFGEPSGIPFEVTDATFDSVVLGSERPIVVEFKSEFCGFCQLMKPIVAEVAAEHRETFTVVKLDVNTQPEKTAEYEIFATPTYIVFQNGEVAGSFVGAKQKEVLVEEILALIKEETAPAAFVNVIPFGGAIATNDSVTITFDNVPSDVTVNAGTVTVVGKTAIITGPFTPGPLALTITWADGSQTINYIVTAPDTIAPTVTGGTVRDGDRDVDSEVININARIEITFSEYVTGSIALQTEGGDDVGWLSRFEGTTGILELVKGKEIGHETTYVIAGKVSDAAGNSLDVSVTFVTEGKE